MWGHRPDSGTCRLMSAGPSFSAGLDPLGFVSRWWVRWVQPRIDGTVMRGGEGDLREISRCGFHGRGGIGNRVFMSGEVSCRTADRRGHGLLLMSVLFLASSRRSSYY